MNVGSNQAILDVQTRWNSTFNMLERLVEIQQNTEINLYDIQTEKFVKRFIEVFKPIKVVTLKLQSSQLIIGDFYKNWMDLKLNLGLIEDDLTSLR